MYKTNIDGTYKPLTRGEYKKLSKEDKRSYRKIRWNHFWSKPINKVIFIFTIIASQIAWLIPVILINISH